MSKNESILTYLEKELTEWESLLSNLNEYHLLQEPVYGTWTVKDVLAHLYEWQRVSISRLKAGIQNSIPEFPDWFIRDPESEKERDELNRLIYNKWENKSWNDVYGSWKNGFKELIELSKKINSDDLNDKEKFKWLDGYSLNDVLEHSYIHHHEDHLLPIIQILKIK
jgi:hypothetical protein